MNGPETRLSLLARLHDSSEHEAWAEFAEIYEPVIYRVARRRGLQHADALDLTQEVLAAVSKAIERFDADSERGTFRGWLYRITRNLAVNASSRQRGPRGSGDTGMLELLESQPANDDLAASRFDVEHRREVFRWAAQRVRPLFQDDTWRAFWLTGVEGESIEDVAQLLGKSNGAVRIARCRVLSRLRKEAAEYEENDESDTSPPLWGGRTR